MTFIFILCGYGLRQINGIRLSPRNVAACWRTHRSWAGLNRDKLWPALPGHSDRKSDGALDHVSIVHPPRRGNMRRALRIFRRRSRMRSTATGAAPTANECRSAALPSLRPVDGRRMAITPGISFLMSFHRGKPMPEQRCDPVAQRIPRACTTGRGRAGAGMAAVSAGCELISLNKLACHLPCSFRPTSRSPFQADRAAKRAAGQDRKPPCIESQAFLCHGLACCAPDRVGVAVFGI